MVEATMVLPIFVSHGSITPIDETGPMLAVGPCPFDVVSSMLREITRHGLAGAASFLQKSRSEWAYPDRLIDIGTRGLESKGRPGPLQVLSWVDSPSRSTRLVDLTPPSPNRAANPITSGALRRRVDRHVDRRYVSLLRPEIAQRPARTVSMQLAKFMTVLRAVACPRRYRRGRSGPPVAGGNPAVGGASRHRPPRHGRGPD